MKILSLLWGFSTGGIGKVAITYGSLNVENVIEVYTVCVIKNNHDVDLQPLLRVNSEVICINNNLDFSWLRKLKKIIDEYQPARLFVHGFNGPVIAFILLKRYDLDLPVICSYHGQYHAASTWKKILKPLFDFLPLLFYKYNAIRVICVEKSSQKSLIEKGVAKEKIVVVYNGLQTNIEFTSLDLNDKTIPKNKLTILTASRIEPVKGIVYLLDAISIVRQKIQTPIQLIIIGTGPELESLKDKTVKLGIDDIAYFVGYQNNIPAWLEFADVFALPSLSECHSIGMLEAMRAAKAIVATNVGGNPESINDGKEGILVSPKDVESLTVAITRLIEDKELRINLGISARKRFLCEFTEERMKENLILALTI